MKSSSPALKVENGIDFPVLGCSGELIRYNLPGVHHPRGVCGAPCLPCFSTPQRPAPQPRLCKPREMPCPLSQGFSSDSGRTGDSEQKRPGRTQLSALGSVTRGQATTHRPGCGPGFRSLPSPITVASRHSGERPALEPVLTQIESHVKEKQALPWSEKQGIEAETTVSGPGYKADAAPQAHTPKQGLPTEKVI